VHSSLGLQSRNHSLVSIAIHSLDNGDCRGSRASVAARGGSHVRTGGVGDLEASALGLGLAWLQLEALGVRGQRLSAARNG
jgi:hypothetical protein